ncbi:MAG: hypothetical protein KAW56_17885 [Candidatus Marinimicrobia bacterium]|nr:hypothetical protein [Candidatus Neomarinimicrobiota bacterium]
MEYWIDGRMVTIQPTKYAKDFYDEWSNLPKAFSSGIPTGKSFGRLLCRMFAILYSVKNLRRYKDLKDRNLSSADIGIGK